MGSEHGEREVREEFEAVQDDDGAAHAVERLDDAVVELVGEGVDQQGDGEEPQHGCGLHSGDERRAVPRVERGRERAEHQRAVHDGLRIAPGDHARGGHGLPPSAVARPVPAPRTGRSPIGRLFLAEEAGEQQSGADAQHDQTAHGQHAQTQAVVALDERADAEEARQGQQDVEHDDDERGQHRLAARLGKRRIDDEQILHADGRDVRQPHRQSLQVEAHNTPLPNLTFGWMPLTQPNPSKHH